MVNVLVFVCLAGYICLFCVPVCRSVVRVTCVVLFYVVLCCCVMLWCCVVMYCVVLSSLSVVPVTRGGEERER